MKAKRKHKAQPGIPAPPVAKSFNKVVGHTTANMNQEQKNMSKKGMRHSPFIDFSLDVSEHSHSNKQPLNKNFQVAKISCLQDKKKDTPKSPITSSSQKTPEEFSFSLDNPSEDLSFTKPRAVQIKNSIIDLKSWSGLIVAVASYIANNNPGLLDDYIDSTSHPFPLLRKRIAISKSPKVFTAGKEFSKGLWIETNYSSQNCVRLAAELATAANLEKDKIFVLCLSANSTGKSATLKKASSIASPFSDSEQNVKEKQEDSSCVSDELLLETVFSLMYQKELIVDEIFRKVQTTYYCLRNFGTMEPVVQRLYPFMRASDYSAHYNPWKTTKDGIQFLILKKCNGLRRGDLLQWAKTQMLTIEDLCNELHCSRGELDPSLERTCSPVAIELPQTHSEQTETDNRKETEETGEHASQINNAPKVEEKSLGGPRGFAEKCGSILDQSFAKGFILNSPISNKRFRNFWENMYGESCNISDEEIQRTMKSIGVEFDGRIYAPSQLASPDIFEEISRYIVRLFNEGKPVIYYQALFDEFSRRQTDWKINSPEMLKSFLAARACPYPLLRSCIAKDKGVDVSPSSEIREYLKEQQEPVDYDKMQSALPHIPLDIIKRELSTNTEFVNAGKGEYMHADIVDLSTNDLDVIANMIQTEIHSKGFMTGTELWDKLEAEYSEYVVRYSHLPFIGFRDALKHKYTGRFNFKGNIISSVDDPIDMADVFAGFCSRRESFNYHDIEQLCDDAGIPSVTSTYFDAVYENSIRISQDNFVSLKSISFDVAATDEAIARFCPGDFIAIAEITSFAAFPNIGVPWTNYLIESFVFKFSKRFKLYHNQFSATVCVGAILRNEAKLFDYNQVLATVIAKSDCPLSDEPALDYLCNAGFLGRRRYAEINIVLSEARQIRSQEK